MNQLYQIPVVAAIFRHLDPQDRIQFGCCDRRMYQLIQNALFWTDTDAKDILPQVSKCGNLWLIEILLQFNINVDILNYALWWAASKGHRATVCSLLDRGADIHDEDDSALCSAAWNGHIEVVRLLLKRGADIHAWDDSALRQASERGHLEIVRLLLDFGANIHVWDDAALRGAAAGSHLETVRLLLDRGADVHVENDESLRMAAKEGRLETVRLLLDRGADINCLSLDQRKTMARYNRCV